MVRMVRPPLTDEERARGERLGTLLRHARGERPLPEIAASAGIPVETLRKIESGRVPTSAHFFAVVVEVEVGVAFAAKAVDAAWEAANASVAPRTTPPATMIPAVA